MLGSGKTGAVRAFVTVSSARSRDADLYRRYAAGLYRQALLTRGDPVLAEHVVCDVIVNEAALARIAERSQDDARYRLTESVPRRGQQLAAGAVSRHYHGRDRERDRRRVAEGPGVGQHGGLDEVAAVAVPAATGGRYSGAASTSCSPDWPGHCTRHRVRTRPARQCIASASPLPARAQRHAQRRVQRGPPRTYAASSGLAEIGLALRAGPMRRDGTSGESPRALAPESYSPKR